MKTTPKWNKIELFDFPLGKKIITMEETMNFDIQDYLGSIIKVIGIGGGGGNAVNHMYNQGIKDVEFMICNTDAQALANSPIKSKVQLGSSLTEGRGAGNKPEIGEAAACENIEEVKKLLAGNTKMVFITAGMGGGTGTGGAPVIAEACRELNLLTVGIVTIPFRNEGRRRISQAIEGIKKLEGHVDSLLVINNERIREMYGDFPISQAFAKADNVLATAAKGIAEIITVHGNVNVDFADVETVMRNSGVAIMGSALAEGENRAIHAVEEALNSPLLNNNNIIGAKDILVNVTSGIEEITMDEIGQITDYIQDRAGNDADLIWGNSRDENLGNKINVTVIATGFSTNSIPEIATTQKEEKTYIRLKDDNEDEVTPKSRVIRKKRQDGHQLEFYLERYQKPDPIDLIYGRQGVSEKKLDSGLTHRSTTNKRWEVDFANVNEEVIEELERVPAYKRKGIKLGSHSSMDSLPDPEADISSLPPPSR